MGAKRGSWRGLTGHERSGEPSEGFSWVSVVFLFFGFFLELCLEISLIAGESVD